VSVVIYSGNVNYNYKMGEKSKPHFPVGAKMSKQLEKDLKKKKKPKKPVDTDDKKV